MSNISKDTEAILLLCCHLPKSITGGSGPKPLSHSEYIKIAALLHANDLRPSDMLSSLWKERIENTKTIGVDEARLAQLLARGMSISLARDKWERAGVWIISRADATYPSRWKKKLRNRAPALLFGIGDVTALNRGGIGVVGSRNISDEINGFVVELAQKAAVNGFPVVSGGARGVDSVAMKSALDSNGKSFGILADSLLKSLTKKEYRDAIQNGNLTLASPFSPEAGFNAGNAMGRNKLIYASSDYVVVAQSDKGKGGTWAGAIECLEYGWTPVLIQSRFPSEGLHALISKGAYSIDLPNSENFMEYFKAFEGKVTPKLTQKSMI